MKELSTHKPKFSPYLEKVYNSDKPLIIYKVKGGYNLYTDFSKKFILTNKNIKELAQIKEINGFLVGGASLSPKKFIDIIKKSII